MAKTEKCSEKTNRDYSNLILTTEKEGKHLPGLIMSYSSVPVQTRHTAAGAASDHGDTAPRSCATKHCLSVEEVPHGLALTTYGATDCSTFLLNLWLICA